MGVGVIDGVEVMEGVGVIDAVNVGVSEGMNVAEGSGIIVGVLVVIGTGVSVDRNEISAPLQLVKTTTKNAGIRLSNIRLLRAYIARFFIFTL